MSLLNSVESVRLIKQLHIKRDLIFKRGLTLIFSFALALIAGTFLLIDQNPQPAYALSPGDASITMTSNPLLVADSNSCGTTTGPNAAYVAFRITNTSGSTLTNLTATISGLNTAGGQILGNGQPATQAVGTLTNSSSRTLFWYIIYENRCSGPISSNLVVTLSNGVGNNITGTGTITTNSSISANAGGTVVSAILGSQTAVVGQTVTYDTVYSFGNVQTGQKYSFQPAGNTTFNAGCLQLISSTVNSSMVPGINVGAQNLLYFTAPSNQGGTSNQVSVRYIFNYRCDGVTTLAVPYSDQNSGNTNVKYTGNYGGTSISFPQAINSFTVSKTASTNSLPNGGTVIYTVNITNTSANTAILDQIQDVLPVGATFVSIESDSDVTAANSASSPTNGASGTISFTGQPYTSYSVAGNATIKLKYKANIPTTPGVYTNTAKAIIGSAVTNTSSTSVSVGSSDLSISKVANGTFRFGQNASYTLTVTNNGPSNHSGTITVTDALPTGLSFVSGVGSGWTCNASGQLVTCTNPNSLANETSSSITLNVAVSSSAAYSLSNTATVNGTITDSTTGNNSSTSVKSVISIPTAVNDSVTVNASSNAIITVLSNDSDSKNESLSIISATPPSHGGIVVNLDGTITYTPTSTYSGSDSFTYTIQNTTSGQQSTASVNINVVNTTPSANDDSKSVQDGQSVEVSVLANDSDAENNWDYAALSLTSTPIKGSALINPDYTITYTANPGETGTDTFQYQICDLVGACDSATVTITIFALDINAPTVQDDSYTIDEDQVTDLDVLFNDSDSGSGMDIGSLNIISGPFDGSATVNTDGTIKYTPDLNYYGTDNLAYTICDFANNCSTANVLINIKSINDAAQAHDDNYIIDEDQTTNFSVLDNDFDFEGDQMTIVSVTMPLHGQAVIEGNQIKFTPNPDYNGNDSFTYEITDGNGQTATANVTITINSINDPVTANNDNAITDEDTQVEINVLNNDSDLDNDILTITSASTPSHGIVLIDNSVITYFPNLNFYGNDSFTYTVEDGKGSTATATVNITVNSINDPVTANDDSYNLLEDASAIDLNVLNNDSDGDGDSLSIISVTTPTNGNASINGTVISFQPNANYFGNDSFTYTIEDGNGSTATAIVNITVSSVNDPVIANDDLLTIDEDTSVDINVLSNDSDADANNLTLVSIINPTHGTATINQDGTIHYVPDSNYYGADSFTYTVSDGNSSTATATVNLTITSVYDPIIANNDSATTAQDTSVDINVLANDSSPEGNSFGIVGTIAPSHGIISTQGGIITYTPDQYYTGTDTFTYIVRDGLNPVATAIVTVTVTNVNDPVIAVNDSSITNEDTSVDINVLSNDSDADNDPLIVVSISTPSHGTATINQDGAIHYIPDSNYYGTDSFTYTVSDGNGSTATATITITINSVNDPVTANNDTRSTNQDQAVLINVLANDSDGDDDFLTISSVSTPTHGNAVINNNLIIYTPALGYQGTDTFTYTISDGNGSTATATVNVTIDNVNDPAIAVNDLATTEEDTQVSINVLSNDSDGDNDPLSIISTTNPAHGSISVNGGIITYAPDTNYNGTDTFTYTISDGNGSTATATVTITINPVDDPIAAINDNVATLQDTYIDITVLVNDDNPDNDTLEIVSYTQPSHGTVEKINNYTFRYTPNLHYYGTDSFTYTVSDGGTLSATSVGTKDIKASDVNNPNFATATVTIVISNVNDGITTSNDTATLDEDGTVTIDVAGNDQSPDFPLDLTTLQIATPPSHGTVTITSDGKIIYTPAPNYFGTDSFIYQVCNTNGECSQSVVNITINSIIDPPTATNDTVNVNKGGPTTINVLGNDNLPDGNGSPLTVKIVTSPAHGTAVVNPDGTITYTPSAKGQPDYLVYEICNVNNECSRATLQFNLPPALVRTGMEDNSIVYYALYFIVIMSLGWIIPNHQLIQVNRKKITIK
ncbi:MAG: hypothetical protein OHK0017_08390 [Patescibacteria group bacterium]